MRASSITGQELRSRRGGCPRWGAALGFEAIALVCVCSFLLTGEPASSCRRHSRHTKDFLSKAFLNQTLLRIPRRAVPSTRPPSKPLVCVHHPPHPTRGPEPCRLSTGGSRLADNSSLNGSRRPTFFVNLTKDGNKVPPPGDAGDGGGQRDSLCFVDCLLYFSFLTRLSGDTSWNFHVTCGAPHLAPC